MPTLPSGSSYPATSKQRPISSLHIYPHHSYPFIYISYINGKRLGQLDASENHKYRKVRLSTLPSASSYLTTSCLKRGQSPLCIMHIFITGESPAKLLLPAATASLPSDQKILFYHLQIWTIILHNFQTDHCICRWSPHHPISPAVSWATQLFLLVRLDSCIFTPGEL